MHTGRLDRRINVTCRIFLTFKILQLKLTYRHKHIWKCITNIWYRDSNKLCYKTNSTYNQRKWLITSNMELQQSRSGFRNWQSRHKIVDLVTYEPTQTRSMYHYNDSEWIDKSYKNAIKKYARYINKLKWHCNTKWHKHTCTTMFRRWFISTIVLHHTKSHVNQHQYIKSSLTSHTYITASKIYVTKRTQNTLLLFNKMIKSNYFDFHQLLVISSWSSSISLPIQGQSSESLVKMSIQLPVYVPFQY